MEDARDNSIVLTLVTMHEQWLICADITGIHNKKLSSDICSKYSGFSDYYVVYYPLVILQ